MKKPLKKIKSNLKPMLLLAFVLLIMIGSPNIYGQSKETLLSEDFSSGSVPPVGWSVQGGGNSSWAIFQSNDAGGAIPEMYYQGWVAFTGTSRMVSPEINTTGYQGLIVEWRHKILNSSNPNVTLKIETTSDGENWDEVWSWSSTGFIGPETIVVPVTNSDVGSDSFQFALTFDGIAGSGFNSWRIDDISLSTLSVNDVAPTVMHMSSQIPVGRIVIPYVLVENLANDIVSFPVSFEITQNSNVVYSSVVQVEGLGTVGSVYIAFDEWQAVEGDYVATATTLLEGDTDPGNDAISIDVEVTNEVAMKKPLFEVFTSSTCGPCTAVNENLDELFAVNPGNYSLIKYQMDWPSPGDPYFNPQSTARKDYYGVTGIPELYCNGTHFPGAIVYSQFDLNALSIETSMLKIEIDTVNTYINSDDIITVNASLVPFGDYDAGLKLYTIVVEKTTFENTGNNGETEFHNVMMEMLTGAEGTNLGAITAGEPIDISESFDMSTTFMEEPTDLAVVVFVQDDSDKGLIQSEMTDVGFFTGITDEGQTAKSISISPNPAHGFINIHSDIAIQHIFIYGIGGALVYSGSPNLTDLEIKTGEFKAGAYFVVVSTKEGMVNKKLFVR